MSKGSQPVLGSQALLAPTTTPLQYQVSESTCRNLSLFKDLLKEYRRLDDSVTMRMNRNTAQFRDRDRMGLGTRGANNQDEACLYFWKELVANWKGRSEIIDYCVNVMDANGDASNSDARNKETDLDADRGLRARLYAEEVQRTQIRNELTVERIVRNRSLEAFKSRCKYFEPPLNDHEARKWWDAAKAR